ncbi:MAG: sugar ABC transporter ATP-binding protein [Phycisphaerae bacterium]|nr:sugar ABC transporter ATP-binding protein [Phycisphaerae bacterium]
MTTTSPPILCFEGVTKRFPGVMALDGVTFDVAPGECHALMGENGAGKSTLGKIVAGVLRPDGGVLRLDGRAIRFRTPSDAAAAGISIVHQELAFCPNLSIAENLFLSRLPSRRGWVRWRDMQQQARGMLARVGLEVDPRIPIERLSTAQEQLVQIAEAVGRGARIIVMDEPTSSLSQVESQRLFEIIADLRSRGVTILYVSHRMDEVLRLCDRITVLRDGQHVRTRRASETTTDEIVQLMIGRPIGECFPAHKAEPRGAVRLDVQHLTAAGRFEDVTLTIHGGEIVGLAGLVGAGRSELARAIFGIDRFDRGAIRVDGRPVTIRSPRDAIDLGIGLLPEDRKRQGLVLSMTCRENVSLAMLPTLSRGGWLNQRRERGMAGELFGQLRVKAPHADTPTASLSGGNQQKVALAKWLARRCPILILDEPTRGVDVGAKAEIHALIDRLAAEGRAVLLISSELPELLHLSTRIVVLAGGRIVGEVARGAASQDVVMRLMAGIASERLN